MNRKTDLPYFIHKSSFLFLMMQPVRTSCKLPALIQPMRRYLNNTMPAELEVQGTGSIRKQGGKERFQKLGKIQRRIHNCPRVIFWITPGLERGASQ